MNKVLPLAALLLAGCGPNAASLVGKYRGDLVAPKGADLVPGSNIARGLASSWSLELKEDRTFYMVFTVVPIEGTWRLDGAGLEMTPKEIFGFKGMDKIVTKASDGKNGWDPGEPFLLTVSPDGKTLTVAQTRGNVDGEVRFVREQ